MVAVPQDVFNLFPQQGRAEGQAAGKALGGGDDIRLDAVMHVGIQLARAPVAGLDLIHDKDDVFFQGKLPDRLYITFIQRDHAAFALYAFDHDGCCFILFGQRFHFLIAAGLRVDEARRQRPEQLVIMVLSRGGEGRQRAAVEAVFQRDDGKTVSTVFFGGVFARRLDGAFVALRAGIGEEYFLHSGAFTQHLRQFAAGSGIVKVGHMLHAPELRCHGLLPCLIRHAEGGDGDPAAQVDILPALIIPHKGTAARNDLKREPLVCIGNVAIVSFFYVHAGVLPLIHVPAPSLVSSSIRIECGTRPSMMTTFLTPF